MKKILSTVVVVIVIFLVISVGKDLIIKTSAEKVTEMVTGLKLSISSFKVGVINTLVGIRDLRLHNPKGYKDKIMLDMPEIYVDYDLPAIMRGTVHLEEMRINMQEFFVVKNERGELNLDSLKVVQAQKEGKKPQEQEKGKTPQIKIDNLQLKIGKVVYKDYSKGGTPQVREFNVNLNEKYSNITNPYSLVSLIVVKALANTTIANLTNFDLRGLQGTVSDTLASAQKIVGEATAKAQETIKQTTAIAEEAAQKTQQAVEDIQKTTESLKETFKLPFGTKD
ncbi:MAG: hypothetical protein JW869_00865 [Candidatus Omnitrophica bacterium]|nr:hypothetical protein [Candidatus Omnitrophota bacterium]